MKKIIISGLFISSSFAFAGECALEKLQEKVMQSAYSIESINGGGSPITKELYSYSSKENTWAVVFSYSGVQKIWTVVTSKEDCQIKAVYRNAF